MFTRLLTYTAGRCLYKIPQNFFVTQHHAAIIPKVTGIHLRLLHVKVYDKDAGLNAKREANREKHLVEDEDDEDLQDLSYRTNQDIIPIKEEGYIPLRDSPILSKLHGEAQIKTKTTSNESNDDPDVFGNAPKKPLPEDEGDKAEEEYISRPTQRSKKLSTKQYAFMIKEHLNNHRVKEALAVLEVRMLKEDRVKPENYIYNLLISGCAKAGYSRKAFQLYNRMRQRGLKAKESTYTSLFNACANAPSRLDGLTTARRLRDKLLDKGYEPNVKNYNAMIKAFGRWGDIETVYLLVGEMANKNLVMTGETYNFLLQACASDANLGFRHCLLTWHKMLAQGIKPDYYSFNAVLRCVRDCGFGDLETMERDLKMILNDNQSIQIWLPKQELEIKNCTTTTDIDTVSNSENPSSNTLQIQTDATSLELPNLLAPKPHLGSMVSLAEVEKPHERFLLLGGLQGFLELMKSYQITPDIETFTTMLEVIPPTNTAEKQVLKYIRKIGLKADIDFFNILIKKRAMRFDYEGGKEVLSMIRTAGLYPDIVTYGVLALGCTTVESSRELLQQMHHHHLRMNIQILGAMLRQGTSQKSFPYICEIMQISLDENIKPNDVFLRHLHKFYMGCARAIDARHPSTKTTSYKKQHRQFCDKYREYQEHYGIGGLKLDDAIKKLRERPYEHYKEENIEGLEPLKNEKLARKQKLRKYIKKIKLQNLKDDEKEETLDSVQRQIPEPANTNNPFRI